MSDEVALRARIASLLDVLGFYGHASNYAMTMGDAPDAWEQPPAMKDSGERARAAIGWPEGRLWDDRAKAWVHSGP